MTLSNVSSNPGHIASHLVFQAVGGSFWLLPQLSTAAAAAAICQGVGGAAQLCHY